MNEIPRKKKANPVPLAVALLLALAGWVIYLIHSNSIPADHFYSR